MSLIRILFLGVAFCLPAGSLRADTHYVSLAGGHVAPFTNWTDAATDIQSAVDAAVDGDLVLVGSGEYGTGGRVVAGAMTNRVVIDKVLTVRSFNGPDVTRIRGQGPAGSNAVRCVWMTNSAALIGFTLTGGATLAEGDNNTERSGGGLLALPGGGMVSNCVIVGNESAWRGGGAWGGDHYDCNFLENTAWQSGGGVSFFNNMGTLNNCTVSNNVSLANAGGVYGGTLNSCLIAGNSAASGGGALGSTINNCTVVSNTASTAGGGARQSTLHNCKLTGNVAATYGGGAEGSTLNNCLVSGNRSGNQGGTCDRSTLRHRAAGPR